MKTILAVVALALLSLTAHAADSLTYSARDAKGGGMALTLYEGACTSDKVLKEIRKLAPEYEDKFYRAVLQWEGKTYDACWIAAGDLVYAIDETGDMLLPGIPFGAFTPTSSENSAETRGAAI